MKLGATLFFYQLYLNNAQIIDQNHNVLSPLPLKIPQCQGRNWELEALMFKMLLK